MNDAGSQVQRFGESIQARARGEEPPDDGYQGDYVRELAERIEGAAEGDPEEVAQRGIELMLEGVRASLERFRVRMDEFFSEQHAARGRRDRGGARAARRTSTSTTGRSGCGPPRTATTRTACCAARTASWTYFATDIAYHVHKIERGYDHAIDVWGADHHGHIARMQAAWQALGGDPEAFEIVMMQLVSLTEGGERVKMSKRAGAIETLDDLLDDIGVDAARWFLASRSHDTTLDVDLELARSESQDNPVYYVQYAHARIASILRKAGERAGRAGAARQTFAQALSSSIPRPARWSSGCSSCPARSAMRPSGARRTESPRTRQRRPRTSRRSTATAAWSARPRRAATRTCG